jgi:hypothetical protein
MLNSKLHYLMMTGAILPRYGVPPNCYHDPFFTGVGALTREMSLGISAERGTYLIWHRNRHLPWTRSRAAKYNRERVDFFDEDDVDDDGDADAPDMLRLPVTFWEGSLDERCAIANADGNRGVHVEIGQLQLMYAFGTAGATVPPTPFWHGGRRRVWNAQRRVYALEFTARS